MAQRVATPFLGGFYESRTLVLNAQRCMNLFAEVVDTKDGKTAGALYGTPGYDLELTADRPRWRGMITAGSGACYAVVGDALVQVLANMALSLPIGRLLTKKGPVCMTNSSTQMIIIDDETAYGYDMETGKYAAITLPFPGKPGICAYQDGYFLISEKLTQQWFQSDLGDAFTWQSLSFSSKDGGPDPLVSIVSHHRELWLFGSQTTEVWVNRGILGFAFERLDGIFFQVGCSAAYSALCVGQVVIWLASSIDGEGMVMLAEGFQAKRVSTHAVERAIQSYERIDDAIAYAYQQEGHTFYVLTFPTADATWVYDLGTQLWHERGWFDNGSFHRHRSNCCAMLGDKVLIGDWENGNLYSFNLDTYDDAGMPRKWLRSWPAQAPGQIRLTLDTHWRGELYLEPGVGRLNCGKPIRVLESSDDDWRVLASADTDIRVLSGAYDPNCEDPQIMLRFSDDGGLSWSHEKWRSPGKIGETTHRCVWNRLGPARDRIYEVSSTDPFKPALLGFFVDIEPGEH